MIRNLLATTAIATVLAGGAYGAEAPAGAELNSQHFMQSMTDATLASQLIGETIYTSTAKDAESVGEVNDLIVGNDGAIEAVLIDVGGFLGVGEKTVAVDYGDLQLTTEDDGTEYVVLNTSKDALENAPEFDAQAALAPASKTTNDMATTQPMDRASPDATGVATKAPMTGSDTAANTPAAADETKAPAPDRATLAERNIDTVSSDDVIGATVYSKDEQDIGEAGEVVLTEDGKIDAVVINVGGFLGIGEKPVAVAFSDLEFRSDQDGNIYIYSTFTRDQLEAAATYDKEGYQQNRDAMLLRKAS